VRWRCTSLRRWSGADIISLPPLRNQRLGVAPNVRCLPPTTRNQTMSSSLSSSDTHETNVPFPSSSGHEELAALPDSNGRPAGLRSALKLSSTSSPSGSQNPYTSLAATPQDGSRSASNPSLPSSHLVTPMPPQPPSSFPVRPGLSRARSSGELLPPGYERRVGFSTMETEEPTNGGGTGAEYSFTLQAKSSNYKPRRDSRCFLVATDGESYSIQALDWLMSSLVEVR
jgi:hypothetical protein